METRNLAPARSAFTLIELLIVVAIIAILALIAVPNFLEAQVRAKVSRVRADMRSTATALESYCVDHSQYPWYGNSLDDIPAGEHYLPIRLTTPVAYITTLFNDPFPARDEPTAIHPFHYISDQNESVPIAVTAYLDLFGAKQAVVWLLQSHGPDIDDDEFEELYDPTNGTISDGDLLRFGP